MSHEHEHWQTVYQTRADRQTSWYRPHLDESLRLIDGLALASDAPVIDVGAGRSTLVDDLVARGFTDLTALDLSDAALDAGRARLPAGAPVSWLVGDVRVANLPPAHYRLWHDRAVFHFLTWPEDRERYIGQARRCLRPGGYLLLATFANDGPEQCSGLPVCRYDAGDLAALFADGFEVLADSRENHRTPFATEQRFTYLLLRRDPGRDRADAVGPPHPRACHATD